MALAGAALALAVGGGIAATTSREQPQHIVIADQPAQRPGPMDPRVAAGLDRAYGQALARPGRQISRTEVPASERVSAVRDGRASLAYGCIGELLSSLDAAQATHLGEDFRAAGRPDTDQWRAKVHKALVAAAPTDVGVSDPGVAVGCEGSDLPQYVVALYAKTDMDREDRRALNSVAGGNSRKDLLGTS